MVLSDEQTRGLLTDFQKQVMEYISRIIASGEPIDKGMNISSMEYDIKKNIILPFEDRLRAYSNLNDSIGRLSTDVVVLNSNNKDIVNIINGLSNIRDTLISGNEECKQLLEYNNCCNNYVNKLVKGVCYVVHLGVFTDKLNIDKILDVLKIPIDTQNLNDVIMKIPHFNYGCGSSYRGGY